MQDDDIEFGDDSTAELDFDTVQPGGDDEA